MTEPFVFNEGGLVDEEARRAREEAERLTGAMPKIDDLRVPDPAGAPPPTASDVGAAPGARTLERNAEDMSGPPESRTLERSQADMERDPAVVDMASEAQSVGDAYRANLAPDHPGAETAARGYADVYGGPQTEPPAAESPQTPSPTPPGASPSSTRAREALRAYERARGVGQSLASPTEAPEPPQQRPPDPGTAGGGLADPRAADEPDIQHMRRQITEGSVTPNEQRVISERLPGGDGQRLSDPAGASPTGPDLNPRPEPTGPGATNTRSAPDYTGVDVADAVARPFRAIARGLQVYGGMRPESGSMTPWGDQARARDRQALLDQLRQREQRRRESSAQSDAERQERALALRERGVESQIASREDQQRAREERNAIQRARVESMDDYRQQRVAIQQAEAEGRIDAQQALAAQRQLDVQTAMERRDPESPINRRAQERFRRELEWFQQVTGRELNVDPSGMTVADIEAMETRLGVPRHVRQRAASGGGIGASAPDWFGGTPDEWRMLGSTGRRQAILAHQEQAGGGGGGRGLDLDTPPPRWAGTAEGWRALPRDERIRAVRSLGTQAHAEEGADLDLKIRAAEEAIGEALAALPPEGEDVPGVGRLDSLRGDSPWLQSQEGLRMRTLGRNAVRRYLRLESGAAISNEEMQEEMELRGMGPGATEDQYRQGLRDLQRDVEARTSARQSGRGQGSSGPSEAPDRPEGSAVRVRVNGRLLPRPVPSGRLDELRRRARERGDEVEVIGG